MSKLTIMCSIMMFTLWIAVFSHGVTEEPYLVKPDENSNEILEDANRMLAKDPKSSKAFFKRGYLGAGVRLNWDAGHS